MTATATTPSSPGPAETSEFAANVQVQFSTKQWNVIQSANVESQTNVLEDVTFQSSTSGWAVGYYQDVTSGYYQPLIEYWDKSEWQARYNQHVGSSGGLLLRMAAISANDIWAVGSQGNQTLIEHWDGTGWSVISSANVGTDYNVLYGVVAVTSSNVWAVGYHESTSTFIAQTLIEHWDGTSWSIVSSPNQGTNNNVLSDEAVISASDIWAVGNYSNSSGYTQTLTEHWNGASWSIVSSPNQGTSPTSDDLEGVVATATSNVWAVGRYYNNGTNAWQTLVERWNGSSWSIVSSPNIGTDFNTLHRVVAISASNIWVVGYHSNSTTGVSQTLIEQWNGSSWSIVSSPGFGSDANELLGITVVSSSEMWAVGDHSNVTTFVSQTLAEHWNGSSWTVVTSPEGGPDTNQVNGVAAISTSDVWSVGYYYDPSISSSQTLAEHWDGTGWSVVSIPNINGSSSYLTAVAAISTSNVWAVGYAIDNTTYNYQTLIEHWDGTGWSIISSANTGTYDTLSSVKAISANDIWVVGNYYTGTSTQPLIEHWNGSNWSTIANSGTGAPYSILDKLTAISTNNVWAVGYFQNGSSSYQTLVEHWNGTSWSIVSSPNVAASSNYLNGVVAISANDIWATGYFYNSTLNTSQTLAEHWNGSSWSIVSTPDAGTSYDQLNDVVATSTSDVWAVGDTYNTSLNATQTLVEHWNGSSWSVVSSPSVGTYDNLIGATTLPTGNVWAVGSDNNLNNLTTETLIEFYG